MAKFKGHETEELIEKTLKRKHMKEMMDIPKKSITT